VKDGGLGICSAEELALPAFLSSVRASIGTTRSLLPSELIEEPNSFFDLGCEEWKQKLGVSEFTTKFSKKSGTHQFANRNSKT
jgi:hypothetical protein